ncbi:glucosamine-6-phosphate deaminase [Jeotgalibacillus sp. S-D1]|uniref:6-phosphogluconolactonase n=1 Tax=Jeotgalibacillus sp. S-D1 TaxID=2552189 RepID=UPI00105A0C6E|nr:6-phosphogluconolactonase [Jeotgalibacillus sp. S-D1]TDL31971.1 glucosamine-6-phosphate deaminase [Jeotgalibacillus sp. S-D1]
MIRIFPDEAELAEEIAKEMLSNLTQEEEPVFCLASGSTPQKSYRKFAESFSNGTSVSKLRIVSLDEWTGIERNSEGSCYQMLDRDLFSLIGLKGSQIEFFDGTSSSLEAECQKIDDFILQHPITFSLMGVGMNGHIGLNEPGCQALNYSTVVPLSETTKTVAQKYFNSPVELDSGLTMGLEQITRSKRVIVAITGERKAEIAKEIFTNPEAGLPAQQLLGLNHVDFFLDRAAARYIEIYADKKD